MTRFISILISKGLITQEQYKEAQIKQLGAKKPIQDLLVEMGFITEDVLTIVFSKIFNVALFDLEEELIDPSVTELVPYNITCKYSAFPVRKENNELVVAMSNPDDIVALEDISIIAKVDIKPVLCLKSQITSAIEKYYKADETLYDLLKNINEDKNVKIEIKDNRVTEERFAVDALKSDSGAVPRLMNFVLSDAIKARASDIHIEPEEDFVRIRYRIDGELRNIVEIPQKLLSSTIARIKIMTNLDISETRKPQDGRISISAFDRKMDIRVSIVPTYFGEKVVLRVLDPNQAKIPLEKTGFSQDDLKAFKDACDKPQGMVLVTGPTGSGKTSTLYAALNYVNNERRNIITIEDPIEYIIPGVTQMQVNPAKNFTFTNGLKSILRQDPNIILVGEIRDKDTADIAFQSSLTGHLVFSTLHTNNAVASITRLLDIGLEPYLPASSLILVAAQRLVKVICPYCKEPYTPSENILNEFRAYIDRYNIRTFYRGKGCQECRMSGYFGRTGIFEVLKIDSKLREMISAKMPEEKILKEAQNSGFKMLIEAGIEKVVQEITTLEEVARVTNVDMELLPAPEKPKKTEEVKKVLIVDDEANVHIILENRLKREKMEVLNANNGKEGIEMALREKPDLIIMDLMMPVMDGLTATKKLKSNLETAFIPIMILTARNDVESELKGIAIGADDYMGKPFEGARLIARAKMLMRRNK